MPSNYNELVGKMRIEPSFAMAEEVIRKDFKLKLPSRTSIHMFNSPEISQFRGYQEDLLKTENRIREAEREKLTIREAAADAQVHTPDIEIVRERLNRPAQSYAETLKINELIRRSIFN